MIKTVAIVEHKMKELDYKHYFIEGPADSRMSNANFTQMPTEGS